MPNGVNINVKQQILSELNDCLGYAEKRNLYYAERFLKDNIRVISSLTVWDTVKSHPDQS